MTIDESGGPSAIFSLARHTPYQERLNVLSELASDLTPLLDARSRSLLDLVLWTRTAQTDSKLIRKKGFWRLFTDIRSMLPTEADCDFSVSESADGVRFLATARLPLPVLAKALAVALRHTRCAGAVLVGAGSTTAILDPSLATSLDKATNELELARLLLPLCERHDVAVLIPTGRFDDRETGVFVCGPKEWGDGETGLTLEV